MARQPLIPFGLGIAEPMLSLHREMNRLFDDALRGSLPSPSAPERAGGLPSLFNANMDVAETDDEIRVSVELPGVSEEDIEVNLAEDLLTIRGEKKLDRSHGGEAKSYQYVERSYGSFQRSMHLPFSVNPEEVRASFENGVLTVTVPKTAQKARSRKIPIQRADDRAAQDQQRKDGLTAASNDVAAEAGPETAAHAASPSATH